MTSLRAELTELVAFNDWATRRIFEAVGTLSAGEWTAEVGGSFSTIAQTMGHSVGAEWIWLERWKGSSPSSAPGWMKEPKADELAERWEEVAAERARWLAARTEADVGAPLDYRRLDGEPGSTRLDVLVRHVVNHSTYHRGQVAAFLRTLGKVPPSTDLVLWDRLRLSAAG